MDAAAPAEHRSIAAHAPAMGAALVVVVDGGLTAWLLAAARLGWGASCVTLVALSSATAVAFGLMAMRLRRDTASLQAIGRSERRRAARAAEELERMSLRLDEAVRREHATTHAAFDTIMTLSQEGLVERFNAAGECTFMTVQADVVGRSFDSLVELEDAQALSAALLAANTEAGARPTPLQATAYRADGKSFPVEVVFTRIPDGRGASYLAVVHDTSDRERVVATEASVLVEAGHRLRTPLASITGALGLLRAEVVGRLPKPAQNLVGIAHANVATLTELVGELIDAQGAAPPQDTDLVRIDLHAVFERAREEAAAAFRACEVTLEIEGSGAPVWTRGHEATIAEVARSLLEEARRGSPAGGVVRLAFATRDDVVQLSIESDGQSAETGLAHAHSRLAGPDGVARQHGGGAKLAQCKSAIEQLGGRMFVAADPVLAGRLYIDLPAFAAAPASNAPAPAAESASGVPRVLICEDDAEVSELLRAAVKVQGGRADTVCTLQQAEAALATGRFDLLILDLRLPDGHGLEFLRTAPARAQQARPPVIILSAEARQPLAEQELNVVIADWLRKPIRLGVLRRAIRDAFDKILGLDLDRRPTILHVEDDPDIRRLVQDLLHPTGDVIHAESLFEARRKLAAGEPDLIVLDIGLRDGSGLELMPMLTNRRGERIPTIVFSGRALQDPACEGVDRVFTKSRGSLEALAVQAHLLIGAGAQRHATHYEAA